MLHSQLGAGTQSKKHTEEDNSGYGTQTLYALVLYGQNSLSGTGETRKVDLRWALRMAKISASRDMGDRQNTPSKQYTGSKD